jgi:hypothetical protein
MSNPNQTAASLSADLQRLLPGSTDPENRTRMSAYSKSALPSAFDEEMTAVIDSYKSLTPDQRNVFAHSLAGYQPGWFDTYSLRMSMIAARQRDASALINAFVALTISAATAADERDVLMSKPTLYRALVLINEDMALVQSALEYAPDERVRKLLDDRTGGALEAAAKPLSTGGYREIDAAHGVIFLFGTRPVPPAWL